jgi:hypothetical protein
MVACPEIGFYCCIKLHVVYPVICHAYYLSTAVVEGAGRSNSMLNVVHLSIQQSS